MSAASLSNRKRTIANTPRPPKLHRALRPNPHNATIATCGPAPKRESYAAPICWPKSSESSRTNSKWRGNFKTALTTWWPKSLRIKKTTPALQPKCSYCELKSSKEVGTFRSSTSTWKQQWGYSHGGMAGTKLVQEWVAIYLAAVAGLRICYRGGVPVSYFVANWQWSFEQHDDH